MPRMDAERAPKVLDDGVDDDVDGIALLVQARRTREVEAAPHALHTREQPRYLVRVRVGIRVGVRVRVRVGVGARARARARVRVRDGASSREASVALH